MQARYADDTGIKGLKIRHNNVLGYFVEVTAQHGDRLMAPPLNATFIHRQTLAGQVRFTTAELGETEAKIANAGDRALGLELEIFERLCAMAIAASEDLRAAAHAFAMLDVATALAKLAVDDNYVRPEVDASLSFAIEGGRHPVVEQALKRDGQPFIANACDLSPGPAQKSGQIWLITGPNMAGKSTFLRQNALIALLAQIGSFVPASRARIGIVDRLFSRVGAADDLARGRSTFMVEMVETAVILNQASERSLVILDEIGRGTATFDGLSIAWAAIEHLHEANRCRALFATHYHELTALSAKLPRLFNATVRVKEWQGDVVFLHEVLPGSADRSYGIQVAKLAGLPAPVIARAKSVLAKLEAQDRGQTARALADDLPLFAVPSRAAAEAGAAERGGTADRSRKGAASRRNVAARGAGSAVCVEGEAAEAVTGPSSREHAKRNPRNRRRRCHGSGLRMTHLTGMTTVTARSFLRPFHHNPRFQLTLVANARLSAIAEPNCGAATCSTASAMPNPIRPQPPLAITAAVGLPPMRGCRISIMEVNTTGNSAIMPLTSGPTQRDRVTTVTTRDATSDARSGISYQRRVISGILTWRKRRSSGRQIANVTAFAIRPPASDQCTVRASAARTIQTTIAPPQLISALRRCASTA